MALSIRRTLLQTQRADPRNILATLVLLFDSLGNPRLSVMFKSLNISKLPTVCHQISAAALSSPYTSTQRLYFGACRDVHMKLIKNVAVSESSSSSWRFNIQLAHIIFCHEVPGRVSSILQIRGYPCSSLQLRYIFILSYIRLAHSPQAPNRMTIA